MTVEQKLLARSALGLPNQFNSSYSNRYFCGADSHEHHVWVGLVEAGDADFVPGAPGNPPDKILFFLKPQGALKALRYWETLDKEDFD